MWKLVFIAAALCFSASPLDAAAKDGRRIENDGKRIEKVERMDGARREPVRTSDGRRDDLRRDVERISREIYQPRRR